MVMDIRNLRDDESGEKPMEPAVDSLPAGQAPADQLAAEQPAEPVDLLELLTRLAEGEGADQARAVEELRILVPSAEGIERLCAIVEDAADVRRVPALQVLGYHRQWLSSRSQLDRVMVWARVEEDPEAAAAMTWLLRGRDVLQEFLLHPIAAVAREAALGVPLGAVTLDAALDALLVGRGPDIDRILTQRLGGMHPSLTEPAVEHLLNVADHVTDEALRHVLTTLSQEPLFEQLVEGRSRPAWTAEPDSEATAQLQRWHHVARLASQILMASPSAELVRYLVNRSAADDTFARRHASFLKAAMENTQDAFGLEVIDDLERLTVHASDDRLERMARLLMDLSDKIAGGESQSQVSDLLEKWKQRSPELKLKIFHLQQGLG